MDTLAKRMYFFMAAAQAKNQKTTQRLKPFLFL